MADNIYLRTVDRSEIFPAQPAPQQHCQHQDMVQNQKMNQPVRQNSKVENDELAQKNEYEARKGEMVLKHHHFHSLVFAFMLAMLTMLSYMFYQNKAIQILVHELQRIGDGTGNLLQKMSYL